MVRWQPLVSATRTEPTSPLSLNLSEAMDMNLNPMDTQVTTTNDPSYSLSKSEMELLLFGSMVNIEKPGPTQGVWFCVKVNSKTVILCSTVGEDGKPLPSTPTNNKISMNYDALRDLEPMFLEPGHLWREGLTFGPPSWASPAATAAVAAREITHEKALASDPLGFCPNSRLPRAESVREDVADRAPRSAANKLIAKGGYVCLTNERGAWIGAGVPLQDNP